MTAAVHLTPTNRKDTEMTATVSDTFTPGDRVRLKRNGKVGRHGASHDVGTVVEVQPYALIVRWDSHGLKATASPVSLERIEIAPR